MRVDVIHQRDPDSSCYIVVYVDGVKVNHNEWSFDPGAGYDMEDFKEDRKETLEVAPDFLKPVLAEIYDEMEPTYERWSV